MSHVSILSGTVAYDIKLSLVMKHRLKLFYCKLLLVTLALAALLYVWVHSSLSIFVNNQAVSKAELGKTESYNHPLPWHLVNIQRTYPPSQEIESLSVDIEIMGNVPDKSDFFIVPMNAQLNGQLFYFGAITNIDASRALDRSWVQLERSFVFSKWGENNPLAVQPRPDGFFLASAHEGPHVSVRAPFQWGSGRYTFRLQFLRSSSDSGQPVTWVGAYVHCHSADEDYYVGSIRFWGHGLSFDGWISAFTEITLSYNGAWPPIVPTISVGVGDIRVNGQLQKPLEVIASYDDRVPVCALTLGQKQQTRSANPLNVLFPGQPGAILIAVKKDTIRYSDKRETLFP